MGRIARHARAANSMPAGLHLPSLRLTGEGARVYVALKRDFLAGAIKPGDVLHEAGMAVRFRVSKSPVRDALSALRAEGYVDAIPHRGYVASYITVQDFNELFHLRTILEGEAAGLAALRATDAAVRQLEVLLDEARAADQRADTGGYVEINEAFHLRIARISGNRLLERLIGQLLEQVARAIALGVHVRSRSARDDVYRETTRVITAIRRRAPAAAREVMVEHIERTRRRLLAVEAKAR